jgi:hypothetical protein
MVINPTANNITPSIGKREETVPTISAVITGRRPDPIAKLSVLVTEGSEAG